MHKLFIFFFITSFFFCQDDNNSCSKYVIMDSVNIAIIDKISGEIKHITAVIGVPVAYKRLRAIVRKCFKTKSNDNKQNITCYMDLYDIPSFSSYAKHVFSNWMFSETPSVNIFEHPMFDVSILSY